MERLAFTLLTDGSSGAILRYPLEWIFRQHFDFPVEVTWADLRRLPDPPKGLRDRIEAALDYYPCDLLFVHRDAEKMPLERRVAEIEEAIDGLAAPTVPVVPVHMQEAWFLIDEPVLREAADNPSGKVSLGLPTIDKLERIPNPKQILHGLLRTAGELTGRRRKTFNPGKRARRLGELIQDYGPLRRLAAFRHTEAGILTVLRDHFGRVPTIDQRREP